MYFNDINQGWRAVYKKSIFRQGLFVLAAVLGLTGWDGLAIADEHEGAPAVALEGEILVVHIDYFERGKSEFVYHLRERETGTVYELQFERAAPQSLRTGDKVSVTGRGLGAKVWVQDIAPGLQQDGAEESQAEEPTAAESPSAIERRAILMIVNMATAPDYYTETTAQTGAAEMFTGSFSVDTLYQEASFGQMAFPGTRTDDVIILDNIPYNAGCPYYTIASDADQAATDAGVDLSQYHHKVYLVPPSSISDCGWLALGQLGSYGGTTQRLSWSTRNDVVAYAHEIGHNHGWHHAATDLDNNLTLDSEYGDTSDIMGYCCSERKFNSAHVDQIGWFDNFSGTVLTVVAGGIYDIAPLGSDPAATVDPQVLKIDRPNTTQDYYLSYRQRSGLDANLSSSYISGVNIHHAGETDNWSYFIDALADGESFFDSVNGITVTQISGDAGSVAVEISFDSCVKAAPSVAVAPPSQLLATAGPVSYDVTITNNDTAGCDPASFDLSDNLAALGLTGGLSTVSVVDLAPAAESNPILLSADVWFDDNYGLTVTASDIDGLRNDGNGSANLQLDTVDPLAPANIATTTKKVKGQQTVRVTWGAASDVDPGTGISSYRIYRDGTMVGSTNGLTFDDSSASTNGTYTFTVMSVDGAAHASAPSAGAAYPSAGGGGSNGGGPGGGGGGGGNGNGKKK